MNRNFRSVCWLLLLLLSHFLATRAQATDGVNVQTFNPSTSDHFVLLEDALMSEWPKQPHYLFGANYNYVDEPLVALDSGETTKEFNYINSIQTIDLFFGYYATSHFALYFATPIHFITFPDTPGAVGLPSGSASSLGDMKIMAKLRITDDSSPFGIAIIPEIHLPTGNTADFVSDGSTYLGVRVAFERKFDTFTLDGNIGYASAQNAIYTAPTLDDGIDYRQRLYFGLGGFLPVTEKLGFNLEYSSIQLVPFDKNLNPNELYAGARILASTGTVFTLGGSLGKIGGPSGENYRIIAGVRFTLYDDDAKPLANSAPLPMATPFPVIATPAPRATPFPIAATPNPLPTPAMTKNVVMQGKRIEIMTPIEFENNSDHLTITSKSTLDEMAEVLLKNKKSYQKILIDGHTDNVGTDKYNLKLSLDRAKSVKKYLVSRHVPTKSLQARGFGKRKPKVSYQDPKAHEINRRVEFIVVK